MGLLDRFFGSGKEPERVRPGRQHAVPRERAGHRGVARRRATRRGANWCRWSCATRCASTASLRLDRVPHPLQRQPQRPRRPARELRGEEGARPPAGLRLRLPGQLRARTRPLRAARAGLADQPGLGVPGLQRGRHARPEQLGQRPGAAAAPLVQPDWRGPAAASAPPCRPRKKLPGPTRRCRATCRRCSPIRDAAMADAVRKPRADRRRRTKTAISRRRSRPDEPEPHKP